MKEVEFAQKINNEDDMKAVKNYRAIQKNKKKRFILDEYEIEGIRILNEKSKKIKDSISSIRSNAEYDENEKNTKIEEAETRSKNITTYINAVLILDN